MLDNLKYGDVSYYAYPIHNSTSVFGIDFEGTKFRRYIAVFKAYPQKEIGRVELINMDLTISKRVLFLLYATSFCCCVLGAINWDIIPFLVK